MATSLPMTSWVKVVMSLPRGGSGWVLVGGVNGKNSGVEGVASAISSFVSGSPIGTSVSSVSGMISACSCC